MRLFAKKLTRRLPIYKLIFTQYVPLVALPAIAGSGQGLGAYFNQLYMATVAIGAILAFLKIAFAGAKYSMSGIVTDKESAKHDIQGALLGLAILLIPFIVLNTIYPNLTKLDILQNAGTMKVDTNRTSGVLNTNPPATAPAPANALPGIDPGVTVNMSDIQAP
jgi:hypothetical protein